MAISRLLYSSQTALITTCGRLDLNNNAYDFRVNDADAVKAAKSANGNGPHCASGLGMLRSYLLPVQTISADETIPQEDVLVLGKKGGAARMQKDVATSKVTVKAYLADWMRWSDGVLMDDGVGKWWQSADPAGDPDGSEGLEGWTGTGRQVAYSTAESLGGDGNLDGVGTDGGKSFPGEDSGQTGQPGAPAVLQQYGTHLGPWPGITEQGMLAGEALIQNGTTSAAVAKLGMLEQLAWESMGGYECLVQLFRPDAGNPPDKDGFSFFGIMSSLSIDASKGAYPTLDLSFEGVGSLEYLNMGTTTEGGVALGTTDAGDWFVDACTPHTSDDVLVWGRQKAFNADGSSASDDRILIASNADSYYQDEGVILGNVASGLNEYGDAVVLTDLEAVLNSSDGVAGRTGADGEVGAGSSDTISSAKFSYDMPTETLSNLGAVIEGKTSVVRTGNQQFSKPPYKANMTLDGQGLRMAGWEQVSAGVIREQVLPNEVQIGKLHSVIGKNTVGVSSRSFSQNVGDVGATYNVAAEGTSASFYATYQDLPRDVT